MLTPKKDIYNNIFAGVGRFLARLSIHPNVITLAGLVFCGLACAYLLISKNLLNFCFIVGAVALFDSLDGAVARASGKSSHFGSYLDAVTDRLFDGFIIIAVASVTGYWTLSSIFLLLSFSVSYAKARCEMEVKMGNNKWPDLLERMERLFFYLLGLLLSQIFKVEFLSYNLFGWTLLILNMGVGFTLIQRILRAKRFLAEEE